MVVSLPKVTGRYDYPLPTLRSYPSHGRFIPDELEALDALSLMRKINVLHQEEAAFQPLEGSPSAYHTAFCWVGYFPCADQSIQALERGVRLEWLLGSLGVIIAVVCHCFSSPHEHIKVAVGASSGYNCIR